MAHPKLFHQSYFVQFQVCDLLVLLKECPMFLIQDIQPIRIGETISDTIWLELFIKNDSEICTFFSTLYFFIGFPMFLWHYSSFSYQTTVWTSVNYNIPLFSQDSAQILPRISRKIGNLNGKIRCEQMSMCEKEKILFFSLRSRYCML